MSPRLFLSLFSGFTSSGEELIITSDTACQSYEQPLSLGPSQASGNAATEQAFANPRSLLSVPELTVQVDRG